MTVAEKIEEWAKDANLGFVFVEGRGWLNTQATAEWYARQDKRRQNSPKEWEESAIRFTQAVAAAKRWCSSLEELQEFEEAVKEVKLELPWENKVKPEWWRRKKSA